MASVVKPLVSTNSSCLSAVKPEKNPFSLPTTAFVPTLNLKYNNFTGKAKVVYSKSIVRSMSETKTDIVEEKLGITIRRNPSEKFLDGFGVRSWPKWGCPASEFPWTYSDAEACYLLKGKVKVTPSGSKDYVEFGAGDFVQFPSGMSCTWTVTEAVDKHYKFG